jgi:hypothetical protein
MIQFNGDELADKLSAIDHPLERAKAAQELYFDIREATVRIMRIRKAAIAELRFTDDDSLRMTAAAIAKELGVASSTLGKRFTGDSLGRDMRQVQEYREKKKGT